MEFAGFEGDMGNRVKCQKHGVTIKIIEALFDEPIAILPDKIHTSEP